MTKPVAPIAIVLTGGGTGGHVWPHFALFEGSNPLQEAFAQGRLVVHYVGSRSGMERDLVGSEQPLWHYHPIATGKLRRYASWRTAWDPFKIIWGFLQCVGLLLRHRPAVVFSKGGFVSAPVVWAAWLCCIPVVIHESDATPALATRLTLPFCTKALVTFAQTVQQMPALFRKKVVHVGLPLRPSLFAAQPEQGYAFFNLKPQLKTLLVFGGSLGAQSLNKKVFALLPRLVQNYQVIHLTGKGNSQEVSSPEASVQLLLQERYRQYEFLTTEMAFAYAIADGAFCRAGASSLFELAAARIPMVLVPLGQHASRGDQIINARIFQEQGWAQVMDENTFTEAQALVCIGEVLENPQPYQRALANAPSADTAAIVGTLLWSFCR